jgi:hypothetical protein
MTRFFIAVLLLFALAPNVSAASKDDSTIIPGNRLGPIILGAKLNEIEEILGVPAQSYPAAHAYVWYPRKPSGPLMATIGPDGKVAEVKTYWDVYYTTQGGNLHTGILEDNVRSTLGRPQRTAQWSHYKILYYRGLVFTIDMANVHIVTSITVVPNRVSARAVR